MGLPGAAGPRVNITASVVIGGHCDDIKRSCFFNINKDESMIYSLFKFNIITCFFPRVLQLCIKARTW